METFLIVVWVAWCVFVILAPIIMDWRQKPAPPQTGSRYDRPSQAIVPSAHQDMMGGGE